ncbi:hypothetical protein [Vibrio sp.]|uniref:hypothetical protein n=1 Tax=Vibrio sp. TaxID=678 RepID=UPI003AA7FB0B
MTVNKKANGSIEFDQGSDYVDQIVFDSKSTVLNGITSNGEATHIDTVALQTIHTLTLLDIDNNPVMSVFDADGNYTVTQSQPIEMTVTSPTLVGMFRYG